MWWLASLAISRRGMWAPCLDLTCLRSHAGHITNRESRMAGESARDQARRQREKAARLIESAERWDRGASGEVTVAAALAELESSGWVLLHDLAWPGRQRANIDHVAIGNGRVYVIDAKNWSGNVEAANGILRQNGRSRAKEIAAAAEAARAVAAAVPGLADDAVRPVLCLVREDWFSERFGEVLVCSSQNLVAQLRGQAAATNPLTPEQIARLIEALKAHGHVRREARLQGTSRTIKRPRKTGSKKPGMVKFATAVVTLAVVLSQPAWFTSALKRASEGFVSIFAPATVDPAPVDSPPSKQPGRTKKEKPKPTG